MLLREESKTTTSNLSPVHTTPEELENEGFSLKTHQTFSVHNTQEEFINATITGHFRPSPLYAVGIWKRSVRSENASNVFRPHYPGGIFKKTLQSPVILYLSLRKTWPGKSRDYRDVIVVFQMFSVHTKTKSRRFPIPPVWRTFP